MKDIIDILKDSGVEVAEDKTTDLRKAVAEHYKTINEFTKKVDKYEEQLKTANSTITDLKAKQKHKCWKHINNNCFSFSNELRRLFRVQFRVQFLYYLRDIHIIKMI